MTSSGRREKGITRDEPGLRATDASRESEDAHDDEAPGGHHCHLRPARLHGIAWIVSDDHEPVPLGWETYPGLSGMPDY